MLRVKPIVPASLLSLRVVAMAKTDLEHRLSQPHRRGRV